jgi:hypothetical protein
MNTVASTTYDESMRREVIARRTAHEQALLQRFVRAEAEGDFPGHTAEALCAHCLCILSGMSVQASAGQTPPASMRSPRRRCRYGRDAEARSPEFPIPLGI